MLTADETDYVAGALVSLISVQATPRLTLIAGLYQDHQTRVGEGPPQVLVTKALELCEADRYQRSPAAMVQLLARLLNYDPRIAMIIERIRVPPPEDEDPLLAFVTASKLPFLDRGHARQALNELLQAMPTRPTVVVNGGPKTGKTYTTALINHIRHFHKDVLHSHIELSPSQGRSTGPKQLARDMVSDIGGSLSGEPAQDTNLDRWAQDLANWIVTEANLSGQRWWFVLDGFNPTELRSDTQLLITKLAKKLTVGTAQLLHRLILIDFDRSILTLPPGQIAVETTTPIPHSDISIAVSRILQRAPHLDSTAIKAKVIEGFVDPVTDLPELGQRLSDLIATVEGGA